MTAPSGARQGALELLDQVLGRRRPLDEAEESAAVFRALDARERAFAHRLVLTVLRRLGRIDAVLAAFLQRDLPARRGTVRNILRLGAAQLLFLDTPAHAAVDSSVALARLHATEPLAALVNAVLRRIVLEGAAACAGHDGERLDTPAWLFEALCTAYGEPSARAIARAHAGEPPLDLSCVKDAPDWAARLKATLLPTGSLRLPAGSARVEALEGYAEGTWWVQDAAAALPVRLFGPLEGRTVVEFGAAPGGKTAQLAAAGARVIALDRSPARLGRLRANLERLRLGAELVEADARDWAPPAPADAVLIDAPCSATGTIRRHPEVARVRDAADLPRLCALQDALIAAGLRCVGPGGIVVFATCSLLPEEGERRIEAALAAHPAAERVPVGPEEIGGLAEPITAAGDLRTLPCHLAPLGGLDGFFAARLRLRV